jgi:hypothetical protein
MQEKKPKGGGSNMTGLELLLAGSGVLSGIFGGIGAGQQAKAAREEARLNRAGENRRWAAADPLRKQLMQTLMGQMAQPSPKATGYDFFNAPGAAPQAAPPQPGGVDPRQQILARLLAAQRGGR